MTQRLQNAEGKKSRTHKMPQTSPDLNQLHSAWNNEIHACWVPSVSGSEIS